MTHRNTAISTEKRGEDLLDQGRELVIEHIYFGVGIHIQDGAGGQVDGVDHQIAGQFLCPGKGVVEDIAQDDLHKGQPNGENQEGNANAQQDLVQPPAKG